MAGVDMELAIAVGDRDAAQRALKEMNAQTGARMAARFAVCASHGAMREIRLIDRLQPPMNCVGSVAKRGSAA